jgi:hypothetical protein
MTAGSGVVHSEMPSRDLLASGGRMHGFQVWVNLPATDKMITPRYQEVPGQAIPVGQTPDGKVSVRVIAGEALGASAVIDTHTPIVYQHWTLDPGGRSTQPLPADYNGLVYVFGGRLTVGGTEVADGQVAFLGAGDRVELAVPDDADGAADLLLLAGVPLGEPVVRWGPFVMNSSQQIQAALDDFHAGRMGAIAH